MFEQTPVQFAASKSGRLSSHSGAQKHISNNAHGCSKQDLTPDRAFSLFGGNERTEVTA